MTQSPFTCNRRLSLNQTCVFCTFHIICIILRYDLTQARLSFVQ